MKVGPLKSSTVTDNEGDGDIWQVLHYERAALTPLVCSYIFRFGLEGAIDVK